MANVTHALDIVFGDSPELITWWQMTLRAVLIFAYGIVVFRLSYKRFFGQSTDFDIVIAVLIGSTMSRALTANARLLPTLVATTTLIVLHGLLARMAWRWRSVGWVAKGVATRLVDRGCMDRRAMRRCAITEQDLLEAVRAKGTEDLSRVEVAVLERNGKISIILRETEQPKNPA
jgi:uncharacterized membrane protein YcaP (DUF421 family)